MSMDMKPVNFSCWCKIRDFHACRYIWTCESRSDEASAIPSNLDSSTWLS